MKKKEIVLYLIKVIFYVERKKNENWEMVRNNMKKRYFQWR